MEIVPEKRGIDSPYYMTIPYSFFLTTIHSTSYNKWARILRFMKQSLTFLLCRWSFGETAARLDIRAVFSQFVQASPHYAKVITAQLRLTYFS